jgi:hypothetical protein
MQRLLFDIQLGLALPEQPCLSCLFHHLDEYPQIVYKPPVSALTYSMLPLKLGTNGTEITEERLQPETINEILTSLAYKVAG